MEWAPYLKTRRSNMALRGGVVQFTEVSSSQLRRGSDVLLLLAVADTPTTTFSTSPQSISEPLSSEINHKRFRERFSTIINHGTGIPISCATLFASSKFCSRRDSLRRMRSGNGSDHSSNSGMSCESSRAFWLPDGWVVSKAQAIAFQTTIQSISVSERRNLGSSR